MTSHFFTGGRIIVFSRRLCPKHHYNCRKKGKKTPETTPVHSKAFTGTWFREAVPGKAH